MKTARNSIFFLLTLLLVISLCLLSACGGSSPSPTSTATASPTATPASEATPQIPSPRGSAEMTLNGKKLTVDYGRPSMRGRKIMGELVPFNQIWRTGANKATHFTTEADLMMDNVTVPKGTYTLFTIPSEKNWKLIINKQTGQWGTPYKPEYEKDEVARIDMPVETLPNPVEQFTISLEPSGEGGILKMQWEQTQASVKFTEKK
jgi:hypothetical protein